jgi:hypothetical protein
VDFEKLQHFDEKLREDHQIELSYTWVKQTLQAAGRAALAPEKLS